MARRRANDFFSRVEVALVKIALLILLFITLTKMIWAELAPFIAQLLQRLP